MGSDGCSQKSSGLPPFLAKTYEMVEDPSSDHIVSWSSTGASFIIWNSTDFSRDLLPKYFKHNNFSSFVRQLNTYGFRKTCPDQWEFATKGFLKGERDAMKTIRRRKPLGSSNSSCQVQDDVEGQHLQPEPPRCTISEHQELEGTVKRLQQEKKHLLDQLTKLQHEQQSTETDLVNLADRLQAMEERQQQIVSFFARIVNPSFWGQFAQQPAESNLLLAFYEKRGLLDASEEVLGGAEDQRENLAGSADSRVHNVNSVGRTPSVHDEGFPRQLSLCPPCGQPPGTCLQRSDGRPEEAHTPAEYLESRGCVDAAEEQQRVLIRSGCSQHEFSRTAGLVINDADFSGQPHPLDSPRNNSNITLDADKPCEQVMRQLSLLPCNQSVGSSPMSLSSVTFNGEVRTPAECLETHVDEMVHGQTTEAAIKLRRKRGQDDEVCYGHTSEATIYSKCTRKLGDDRVALTKHLHDRLRTVVSSASKFLGGQVRNAMVADGSGSNDVFWEKYLTESPCSTDTEPDSESDEIEDCTNPQERQFL